MTKFRRVRIALAAIFLLFFLIASFCLIAFEAGHDCPGEQCPVCLQIHICKSIIKAFSALRAAVVFLMAALCVRGLLLSLFGAARPVSPVSLKVKLLN